MRHVLLYGNEDSSDAAGRNGDDDVVEGTFVGALGGA